MRYLTVAIVLSTLYISSSGIAQQANVEYPSPVGPAPELTEFATPSELLGNRVLQDKNPVKDSSPIQTPSSTSPKSTPQDQAAGGPVSPGNLLDGESGTALQAPSNSLSSMLGSRSLGITRGSLAAIPSMIGDTTAGGCGVLRLNGGFPVGSVAHPTFACSRLNIAENNSPELRDRAYLSYRYFHEASTVSVFPDSPNGGQSAPDLHRVTLGFEKTFGKLLSVEFRLPINRQLSSDLTFSQQTGAAIVDPPRISLPLDELETSFGNIGLIFKALLWQNERTYVSAGAALNFPTSPDVRLRGTIDDDRFLISDPNGAIPDFTTAVDFTFDAIVFNTLYSLSPFIGFTHTITDDYFCQGFMQWDAPVTPLKGTVNSQFALPDFGGPLPPVSESGDIEIQDLLRVNFGVGRYLYREIRRDIYREIAVVTELHYTHTLEDAKLETIEVIPNLAGIVPKTTVDVGNIANQTDILDLVFGLPMRRGPWRFINGVIVPLRPEPDRGFEYELNSLLGYEF